MEIIDFERKGNVIRFYLGEKTPDWGWTNSNFKDFTGKTPEWLEPSDTYYGDDWDDTPYKQNASKVYAEFIKGYFDVKADFDDLVLEPCDGVLFDTFSSEYSKADMVNRKVPCIIIVPKNLNKDSYSDSFSYWLKINGVKKYYFGDKIDADIIKINY